MLTAYTLDRDDRITDVDPGWDAFALANDGPAACAAHVLGARLGDSIDGDPTRMFMTAILMRVRASGVSETVPYRCDSDRVKRHYVMSLTPLPEGRVRVEHKLEREEPTGLVIRIRPAERAGPAPLRCSICCRVKEDDAWRDPFEGGESRTLRVVHTVCPDCKAAPMRRFRERRTREETQSGEGARDEG